MGGSLALAIKNFHSHCRVSAVDFPPVLEKAVQRNALDRGFEPSNLAQAVQEADVVFVATPIDNIKKTLPRLAESVPSGCIITDLGSTKRQICEVGSKAFSETDACFIGGHPMAGAETQGIEGAHPLLYENSVYILTETSETPPDYLAKLTKFLKGLGAEPVPLPPDSHDRIVARISHLPQLIATGLVNHVKQNSENNLREQLKFSGGGFRDMTRIAQSQYQMWEDIFSTNKEFIKEEIGGFIEVLEGLADALDNPRMEKEFNRARETRMMIPQQEKGIISSTERVAVMVPDRPGALAELTSCLADQGINIKDLELQKVREDYRGTFLIRFSDLDTASRAAEVLREKDFDARVMDS